MKVSVNWLSDYFSEPLDPQEVADRLTMSGLACESFEKHGDDVVLELETATNRPDHLGHLGIAREISCLMGLEMKHPEIEFSTVEKLEGKSISELVTLEVVDRERCPRYVARVAFDVKVGSAPDWMKKRLEALGLRSVNNIVDISNYVLLEYGQPLHAFDFDRLSGGAIQVRKATQGESFTAINEKSYELDLEDLMIADGKGSIAIAGIMGGLQSEVSADTTRVLLESAWFEPVPVRLTSRRLQLASDSSYRFERRVDPNNVDSASRRFMHLLEKFCSATIVEGCCESLEPGLLSSSLDVVELRHSRLNKVLGLAISEIEVEEILTGLGFKVTATPDGVFACKVPSFRTDVTREIDLVEEVARIHGFDRIEERALSVQPVKEDPRRQQVEATKTLLVAAGYHEGLTFSFAGDSAYEQVESWWNPADPFEIRNPMRANERFLRRSLLPNLLASARGNRLHGVERVRLFEIARVFHRRPGVERPEERDHLAWISTGDGGDFRQARGVADALFKHLQVEGVTGSPVAGENGMSPENSVQLDFEGEAIGIIGSVELEGVAGETWCGELYLGRILESAPTSRQFREFSRLPAVHRDLNFVVENDLLWRDLQAEVEACDLQDLELIEFVDVYRGNQVGEGRKSVTFSLSFRSSERTLTGDEVDERVSTLVEKLGEKFGAELRA